MLHKYNVQLQFDHNFLLYLLNAMEIENLPSGI